MESITIDIINPKARKMLNELQEQKMISIRSSVISKQEFVELLDNIRSRKSSLTPQEITEEVESVRSTNFAQNDS